MSFTNQLVLALVVAVITTFVSFGLGPVVQGFVQVVNANIVASAAIGLPVATTVAMLITLLALQR